MIASKYGPGTAVVVNSIYPPGHVRTPFFVRGKSGIIDRVWGVYPNPEELAYGRAGNPTCFLYQVAFLQTDLWKNYGGSINDTLAVDIYEHWLELET